MDTIEKQKKCRQLVDESVLACQTSLIDAILAATASGDVRNLPTYDDVQNQTIERVDEGQYRYIITERGDDEGEEDYTGFHANIWSIDEDGDDFEIVFEVTGSLAHNMILMDVDPTDPQEVYDYFVSDTTEAPFPPKDGTCLDEDDEVERTTEDQDALEWWLVDSWLAGKLTERGEIMLEYDGDYWWGRGCSGQAIYMDSVIETICKGLGYFNEKDND